MSIIGILLIVLVIMMIGSTPYWGHGGFGHGYYPSGALGLILVVLVILLLVGRI